MKEEKKEELPSEDTKKIISDENTVNKNNKKEDNININENIKEEKSDIIQEEPQKSKNDYLKKIIKELNEIKLSGNELFKKNLYDEAIIKYKEGFEIITKELIKINQKITIYDPQIKDFYYVSIQIMSNLSLSYLKKDKFKESIELDSKIISLDPKYDKSYARLFKSYLKLGKKAEAVYFGDILIKNFDNEIREKYKDLIPKIEAEKKNLEKEEKIEKEKKEKN